MLRAVRKAKAISTELGRRVTNLGQRLHLSQESLRPAPAVVQEAKGANKAPASERGNKEDEPLIKREARATFWSRHFGTDALLGSWCLLAASMLYALYGAELAVEAWGSESTLRQTFAWGNATSGVMFAVGSLYFVNLSYPEETERCATEALAVDLDTLSYVEGTFTFNDMLIATWSFELACVPYLAIAITYLAIGVDRGDSAVVTLGAFFLVSAVMLMACLYVWVLSAMPHFIQQNGGAGSSRFYDVAVDPLFGRCCEPMLRRHLGTDLQAGGWLFFAPCVVGSFFSMGLVYVAPLSFDAWSFLIQACLLAVGAGLLLRSMYPAAASASHRPDPPS